MRRIVLLLPAILLLSGCYTDPSSGRLVFGRRPSGPTEEQLRMQRMG